LRGTAGAAVLPAAGADLAVEDLSELTERRLADDHS
jgi:hypothetical protein